MLVEDPDKYEPVTPCMYVYKNKMQSDGSLDKLKLRIMVRVYLQNNELVGDNWSQTASTRNLKYLLVDATKQKERDIRFHWSIIASKSEEHNISDSSWRLFVTNYLQLIHYFADIL